MDQAECKTLWLTGLSGAGKTTLAYALAEALASVAVPCKVLDGDAMRLTLSRDLGFSRQDRRENVRRVALESRALNHGAIVAIVALISPYRTDRELAREIIGNERFVEVHVSTPLEVCEKRDSKGLYAKARDGRIERFTGVSDPYEAPVQPALRFDSSISTPSDCVAAMLAKLGVG